VSAQGHLERGPAAGASTNQTVRTVLPRAMAARHIDHIFGLAHRTARSPRLTRSGRACPSAPYWLVWPTSAGQAHRISTRSLTLLGAATMGGPDSCETHHPLPAVEHPQPVKQDCATAVNELSGAQGASVVVATLSGPRRRLFFAALLGMTSTTSRCALVTEEARRAPSDRSSNKIARLLRCSSRRASRFGHGELRLMPCPREPDAGRRPLPR